MGFAGNIYQGTARNKILMFYCLNIKDPSAVHSTTQLIHILLKLLSLLFAYSPYKPLNQYTHTNIHTLRSDYSLFFCYDSMLQRLYGWRRLIHHVHCEKHWFYFSKCTSEGRAEKHTIKGKEHGYLKGLFGFRAGFMCVWPVQLCTS